MAAGSNIAAAKASGPELTITRIFDAPRSVVYKAIAEPERQAKWLGPEGFTTLACEMDTRPGGKYRFGMRSPEGTEHWIGGTILEIVENERLRSTWSWLEPDGTPKHETILTFTFEDYQGKTRLTLHQSGFESEDSRDQHRGGWNSNLNKLASYLANNG